MIFKKLSLMSFGKFQNQEITFDSGLNVIFGKNEAGKSTIFNAVIGIIFGFKTDRERYRPWQNSNRYCARLLLETQAHATHIERDFEEDTVTLIQESFQSKEKSSFHGKVSPAGRSSERDVYLKKIHSLFGFSEPDIFKYSLFIEQRSLPHTPSLHTSTELKTLISHISEFKYDDIIKRLEERYFELTKKNPKGGDKRNDRLLENIRADIHELEEKVRRAHYDENRLCEIGKKVSDIKIRIASKEQELKKLSKSVEALRELSKLLQKEVGIQKSFLEIKKKKTLVENLLEQRKKIEEESPKVNRWLVGSMIVGLIMVPILFFSTQIGWIWLTFLSIGLSAGITHYYLTFKEDLSTYTFKDLRLKSQLEILPELKHLESQYLQEQKALHELESQKVEIEKHISGINWSIPLKGPDPLNHLISAQESHMETLHYEIKQLHIRHQTEKQNYFLVAKGLENPFTLEEDLFDLKEKEKDLHLKAQALYTAKEMLRDIVVQFRREHLNLFADQTKELYQKITSSNDVEVIFDDMSLTPCLQSARQITPAKQPLSMISLSCGAQDQLFFSMKLALLDLLSSTQKLPLFLDDPFVNFDHIRRKKTLEILKTYSKERQILLFTYDPWYIEHLGNEGHFLNLEAPHEPTA